MFNGGFSDLELLLLVRNSTYVDQVLCCLGYKVWSTFITKFGTIELFIFILDISPPLYTCCLNAMLLQHQRLVYNGGFSNSEMFLLIKNTVHVVTRYTLSSCQNLSLLYCLFLFWVYPPLYSKTFSLTPGNHPRCKTMILPLLKAVQAIFDRQTVCDFWRSQVVGYKKILFDEQIANIIVKSYSGSKIFFILFPEPWNNFHN